MSSAPQWYDEIATEPQSGSDPVRVQGILRKYEPAYDLWHNVRFQQWASTVTKTADAIEKHAGEAWSFDSDHLKLLGLAPPTNPEQELRLYFALRAVVNFWRRKLDLLEGQSDMYEKAKEKLNELGRSGDIRTP